MKKQLYPALDAFASQWMKTGDGHDVYVEQAGNPKGIPALFLHGGPGSSCKVHHRCFFNPKKYHIILMDQRGAGRSRPLGELRNNTTEHLIVDIETVRKQLNIKKWLVFGGSWGATLGLLYAQKYPGYVSGLILRGTFLARKIDADWFMKSGASERYPAAWLRFTQFVDASKQTNLLQAYHQHLFSDDVNIQREATREWDAWGGAVVLGENFDANDLDSDVPDSAVAQARIETHYAINHYFIEENQILANAAIIKDIPCTIIHGKKDDMCPITSSHQLANSLNDAHLICLKKSGHLAHGDEMIDALVHATDALFNE